jgi:hypothetical protein
MDYDVIYLDAEDEEEVDADFYDGIRMDYDVIFETRIVMME